MAQLAPVADTNDNRWRDLYNTMRGKISNVQNELESLNRQVAVKGAELMALREGLDQIQRFRPKESAVLGGEL